MSDPFLCTVTCNAMSFTAGANYTRMRIVLDKMQYKNSTLLFVVWNCSILIG